MRPHRRATPGRIPCHCQGPGQQSCHQECHPERISGHDEVTLGAPLAEQQYHGDPAARRRHRSASAPDRGRGENPQHQAPDTGDEHTDRYRQAENPRRLEAQKSAEDTQQHPAAEQSRERCRMPGRGRRRKVTGNSGVPGRRGVTGCRGLTGSRVGGPIGLCGCPVARRARAGVGRGQASPPNRSVSQSAGPDPGPRGPSTSTKCSTPKVYCPTMSARAKNGPSTAIWVR